MTLNLASNIAIKQMLYVTMLEHVAATLCCIAWSQQLLRLMYLVKTP